jgi:hypothetical protein
MICTRSSCSYRSNFPYLNCASINERETAEKQNHGELQSEECFKIKYRK